MGGKSDCRKIIEQIKQEMKNRKMSSRDLSKVSALAPSTIYAVMENNSSPRMSTILYICHALNLEVKICNSNNYEENDELYQLIANLSKKKQETVKEFVKILEQYAEQ